MYFHVLFCFFQDLTPDYSMESHQQDHENFLVVSRNRRRRAKALLDFERHDDDELGFRKNDIITVSQVACLLNDAFLLFLSMHIHTHPCTTLFFFPF